MYILIPGCTVCVHCRIPSNLSLMNHLKTTEKVHYIRVFTTSGCSLHQGVLYIRVFTTSGCSLHRGVHYIGVFTTSGCSLHRGVHYIGVFTTSGCSLHRGVHYIRVHLQNRVNRCTFKGLYLSCQGVHCIHACAGFIIERFGCIQYTSVWIYPYHWNLEYYVTTWAEVSITQFPETTNKLSRSKPRKPTSILWERV